MNRNNRRLAALEASSKQHENPIVRIVHQIIERDGTKAERLEREFAIGDKPGPWKVI